MLASVLLLSDPTHILAATNGPAASDYVNQVLARADKGIAYAKQGSVVADFASLFTPWSESVGSAFLAMIDTKLRIVNEARNVPENTACLRVDLYLIEKKMEEVRQELEKALTDKKIMTIIRLQDLLLFLNERFEAVEQGARDPLYQDTAFWDQRLFEPERTGWCCTKEGDTCNERKSTECVTEGQYAETAAGCQALGCRVDSAVIESEKICPFDSDYLPASVTAGYGCDLTALQNLLPKVPQGALADANAAEKDATENVARTLTDVVTKAQSFLSLERGIDALLGRPAPTVSTAPTTQSHKIVQGCAPASDQFWKSGAVGWELRGPFSFGRDEQKILSAFAELRQTQGGRRDPPKEFLSTGGQGLLDQLFLRYGQDVFRSFSEQQGVEEAAIFPMSSDASLTVGDALALLRSSVAKLSSLANQKDGLRGFVRDFAYFLRRTCIDRPCNARLDQILKIVFTDDCFAYTNGEYRSDTCEEPRWKKCAEKALGVAIKIDTSVCK